MEANKKALRFSKSGSDYLNERYATYFVDSEKIKELPYVTAIFIVVILFW